MTQNCASSDEPPFISAERVNIWHWFRGRWVVHTRGTTQYHASYYAGDDRYVVLPLGEVVPDAE